MWWKAIGAVVNICLEAPKAEIYVNSPLCFIPTHTHIISSSVNLASSYVK